MTRKLLPLTALGLFLVPDWAAATGRRRFCPPPPLPVWVPPPVVFCPPVVPVVYAPCPPPVVVPAPAAPAAATPAAEKAADPPAPKPSPRVEADPSPFRQVVPAADKPADTPKLPPTDVPLVPKTPAAPPADPKVPDLKPSNPGVPDVPPLTLPPPKESRTSGSSPVAAPAVSVRLVPAAGPPPASPDARREVVFVNLSAAAVVLMVEGESAGLPAGHELTATVPARFKWRLNAGEVRAAEVPADAPGATVVIR